MSNCLFLAITRNEINENTATEIMQHLINRFVSLVNNGEQAMVVRKLASSLVAIFRHPVTPWKQAIQQLAASLVHGGYISEEQSQVVDFQEKILPAMSKNGSGALLFFSIALAEEALRLDSEPQDGTGDTSAIQRAIMNIKDGLLLGRYVLMEIIEHAAGIDAAGVALAVEAMNSWKVSQFKPIISLPAQPLIRSICRHG